jgi:hypothetical protein
MTSAKSVSSCLLEYCEGLNLADFLVDICK